MIERYSRPEMAAIWSPTHKSDTWLKVELLVCEAWAREGVIPADAIARIRAARYNAQRMQEIESSAHRRGLRYARLSTDQPIDDMVQRTLRKLGLLS